MKLLLTSGGIRNRSIATALQDLTGKDPADVKIGFIPTAKNVEFGNAEWFLDQFSLLRQFGYIQVDIIDPSAAGVDWRQGLHNVDVVLVGGGNTFHLLDQIRKTGFDDWLQQVVQSKVYVGISAGSIIATPGIGIASVDNGDVNYCGITDLAGLRWVDFEISPHSPEDVSYEANAEYAKMIRSKLYAYDDETAIKVDDDQIEIITEGKWKLYNG